MLRDATRTKRLIAVYRADASGRYDWLPPPERGDVIFALDGMAHVDLAGRHAILFDALQSWEERNAAERRMTALMVALGEHPAVAAIELLGHRLVDFSELRMRLEIMRLWRGWTLAGYAEGAQQAVCDPTASPALLMGMHARLGLDPAAVHYAIPPAIPGSRLKRSVARPLMRALAAGSRPRHVRVVAVAAGKLSLALTSLSCAELRAVGIGAMPFPGLDHGNSALLALRRRLPLLPGYGPSWAGSGPAVQLPDRLGLVDEEGLDRALTLLVGRVLSGAAPELARSVRALDGLTRARSLRALLLPSAAYGASRLLIEWAQERGIRVGAMQHGIYTLREYDGGDRWADVLFGWGEGTAEQIRWWPDPRPTVLQVGVPGTPVVPPRPTSTTLRRVLIATSGGPDAPIVPAAYFKMFFDALAPGLRRLEAAGVELELRAHPHEDFASSTRPFLAHGLNVRVSPGGPFRAAAAKTDILISSTSSVAFEAAALGLPVLLWLGPAPEWLRQQYLVAPWTGKPPGTFTEVEDFGALIDALLERPAEAFGVAHELGRVLTRYAQPFDRDAFVDGLRLLSA